MKNILLTLLLFQLSSQFVFAQVSTTYSVSFENATQHEATIHATFKNLKTKVVEFRMSRSSPGRYAPHEFAKNVYAVHATDGKGNPLKIERPNPYAWRVNNSDGTVKVSYTLFANHGDGTYAQVDETHAHLNMPATFMYVSELEEQEIEVTFHPREDLGWKIATQLKHLQGNTYYAKNLQYFMDSPTEISNYKKRSITVDSNGISQTFNFVLHDEEASEAEFDVYFEKVKKIVLQEQAVYGEFPKYDYGEYTFLACYMANVSGDGMEHRNSTILTDTQSLANGGIEENIGTVAHEFFHGWNVERIRPKSLEPFDFTRVNMSGELWFAEGFTSYYDDLILCRTGIINPEAYVKGLVGTFNYVWTSPGRSYFNPIEMSYQAPFVDAARSVDDTNRENTFISYYSYGSMLGLALDLSLRREKLNLDDFMKMMWNNYGKINIYYTVEDLHQTLNSYAGKEFGDSFFNNYIYKTDMPDFKSLFESVGVELSTINNKVVFGAFTRNQLIMNNPKINSTAYLAGLQKGDRIIEVGGVVLNDTITLDKAIENYKPKSQVQIVFERYGKTMEKIIELKSDTQYNLILKENADTNQKESRAAWLKLKE
ncbi:MAG: PDZ domain-containing protein [Flavobacteriaceae bacterium]|nr:PDZ domain-containing protein [Flavobacteriaceae bacterium]MDZ4147811.1 PDZ domain-containing protein [Flavobacteriaceae bacterium]